VNVNGKEIPVKTIYQSGWRGEKRMVEGVNSRYI
jgi:hypothetical protein